MPIAGREPEVLDVGPERRSSRDLPALLWRSLSPTVQRMIGGGLVAALAIGLLSGISWYGASLQSGPDASSPQTPLTPPTRTPEQQRKLDASAVTAADPLAGLVPWNALSYNRFDLPAATVALGPAAVSSFLDASFGRVLGPEHPMPTGSIRSWIGDAMGEFSMLRTSWGAGVSVTAAPGLVARVRDVGAARRTLSRVVGTWPGGPPAGYREIVYRFEGNLLIIGPQAAVGYQQGTPAGGIAQSPTYSRAAATQLAESPAGTFATMWINEGALLGVTASEVVPGLPGVVLQPLGEADGASLIASVAARPGAAVTRYPDPGRLQFVGHAYGFVPRWQVASADMVAQAAGKPGAVRVGALREPDIATLGGSIGVLTGTSGYLLDGLLQRPPAIAGSDLVHAQVLLPSAEGSLRQGLRVRMEFRTVGPGHVRFRAAADVSPASGGRGVASRP